MDNQGNGREIAPMMTTDEVAQTLRINRQTVNKWCRSGKIAAKRIGHRYLIAASTVRRLLDPGTP